MIYYNLNTINDWNFGDDNIIKVYKHGAVVFYKFDSEQGGYKVCYAVVEDITQYTDREYEDVYDKETEKWYKLNNLNQYEEYGIYGSGRTSCESSESRLPQGYTEVEYISSEDISESVLGPYIDTNYKPTQNTRFVIEYQSTTNTRGYQRIFGSGEFDMLGYLVNIEGKIGTSGYYYYKFGQTSSWYTTNVQCDLNRHIIDYNNSKQFLLDNVSIATLPNTSFTCSSNLGIFWSINTKYTTNNINFIGRIFSAKVYENGILVRDFVPCISPNNVVGMYDIVNNVFYTSSNNYSFKAGDPVTPTDCVTTYNGKLTIDDGYEYQYSGSSWNNVGEVSGSSRVPDGYTEVEYIENTSQAYINLGVSPYSANGNSFTVETTFSSYTQSNLTYLISCEYTTQPYNGFCARWNGRSIELVGNSTSVDTTAQNIPNGDGTSAITFHSDSTTTNNNNTPITLFCGLNGSSPWRYGKGRLYALKMTLNNSVVRELVPAKRDSDSKYGMYDLVTNTFYVSSNNYNFTGGSATGQIVYPMYYDEIQDPPDNLVFSSMAEAEAYECPWVGMHATIAGDNYIFSGDSQSGYEWVEQSYSKYEYIRTGSGNSYYTIDTGFYPTTANTIEVKFEMVDRSVDWGNIVSWGVLGNTAHSTSLQFATVATTRYQAIVRTGGNNGAAYRPTIGANNSTVYTLPLSATSGTYSVNGGPTNTIRYNINSSFNLPSIVSMRILGGYGNDNGDIKNYKSAVGKLYYVKVYDGNGNIVKHYIPSDNNGTPCFYEIVDGEYIMDTYTGSNHGTLTLGPQV